MEEMAGFLMDLYDGGETVGIVDRQTFAFGRTAAPVPLRRRGLRRSGALLMNVL